MACVIRKRNAKGRGSGRYRYMVKWRDPDGKQRSRTFPDKDTADKFKVEARKIEKGERVLSRSNLTFKELADRFIEQDGIHLSPNTLGFYSSLIRTHLKPRWGEWKIATITRADIEDLRTELIAERSASTTRSVLVCLQRILGYGEAHGWIAGNVARGIKKPSLPVSNRRALEQGEVEALIDAADPRYRMLFYLAVKTGLRQAELLGLEWSAISDGFIHVRQQFTGGKPTSRLKSKYANRHVPIDEETDQQLRRWRMKAPNSRFVFPSESGEPINPSNLRNRGFIPALKAAKIADPDSVTFHSLRHTYGSHAITNGVPLADVSKYMGHSSVSVTADIYHHLMKGSDDRARAATMSLPDAVAM